MNKAEQLIACLEGEIAKRDARIVELESKTVRGFLIIDGMAFNPTEILSQNSDICAAIDQRDRLAGLLRMANTFFVDDSALGVELSDEIEAALARLNAAPVMPEHPFCEYCGGNDEEPQDHCMDRTRPVQQVSVPDGWKLVPVEPTEEMIRAGIQTGLIAKAQQEGPCHWQWTYPGGFYRAMLAAAPAAPEIGAGVTTHD